MQRAREGIRGARSGTGAPGGFQFRQERGGEMASGCHACKATARREILNAHPFLLVSTITILNLLFIPSEHLTIPTVS